jgi:hypothetical protein
VFHVDVVKVNLNVAMLQKHISMLQVLFSNVVDVIFECCESSSPCCTQLDLMLRRDFLLRYFDQVDLDVVMLQK